ncbi:MlaE family ABC transporter permease [Undibacterium parvum]|uniref:ABC transporter permease n=1 Tax=Undibacterium parvum TaxID=401471 RepID=A0A3Q9BR55_9BURK|nr:ABC transporter permease [Undibacterium parvum]AZP12583.1 ABC transporter permease [Undibacterium parvum]
MKLASARPVHTRLATACSAYLSSWWSILLFGAMILSLLPTSLNKKNRHACAHHLVDSTVLNLAWFTVLSALISVVLIRIVIVTALSYGLSRFAIEMVVRVLVLELIPLSAALFVALRCSLPDSAELAQMSNQGRFIQMRRLGQDPLQQEFFPRVLAGVFCVWMLGALSCVMTLLLTYFAMYGFTPWGLPAYTRVVGQVFSSAVTVILALKIFFFSLAVAFIPMASAYYEELIDASQRRTYFATGLVAMVRLFAVLLAIEVISLMGNYY